jgi:hypothetical protein
MAYVLGKNILLEIINSDHKDPHVINELKSKIENVKFTMVDEHVVDEKWFIDGVLGRTDGPAIIEYDDDDNIKCIYYCSAGQYDKKDGPAYINYFSDGNIAEEAWFNNGVRHRVGGPARIKYHDESLDVGTGIVSCEEWYIDGVLNRIGGPAKIVYWRNGKIQSSILFNDCVVI